MSLSAYVNWFSLNTSTGNQSVTGVGFQPKAIIFLGTKHTANGTSDHVNQSIGFALSSSARRCISISSEDSQGDSDSQRAWFDDRIIHMNDAGGSATVLFTVDFVSMDADGFTINISDAPASGFRVAFMALGGNDIFNTAVGNFDSSGSTGSQSITGVGFKPDFLFVLSAQGLQTEGTFVDDLEMMIGFATGTGGSDQVSLSTVDEDGQGSSDCSRLLRIDKFLTALDLTGSIDYSATLSSFDTDGFTINNDTTGQHRFHYLAIKGGSWHTDSFLTRSSSGTFDVTDTSFTPKIVSILSTMLAHSTTSDDDLGYDLGFATSAINSVNAGGMSENGAGTSNTFTWTDEPDLYTSFTPTGGVFGKIEFNSFLSNGFRLDMVDTEISWQSEVGYFTAGDGTEIDCTVAVTLGNVVIDTNCSQEIDCTVAVTLGNIVIDTNCSQEIDCTVAVTLGNIVIDTNCSQEIDCTIDVTLNNVVINTICDLGTITIDVQPEDQSVFIGDTATFSITASSSSPITYQWYRNGDLQVGETSTTYSIVTTMSNNLDRIYCKLSNGAFIVDSNIVWLNISRVRLTDAINTRDLPSLKRTFRLRKKYVDRNK